MERQSVNFLEKYVNTISPSGFEGDAARIWKDEADKFADRVRTDHHGNSFAVVNEGAEVRVMLAGHTDEIGILVSQIDDNGFLFFNTIGGWDNQVLPGQRVRLKGTDGPVTGVIGRKPVHLINKEESKEVVKIENLWIDIGARDKEHAQELVEVGTPGVLDYSFNRLQDELVVARGFDDKGGAFVVLEAARKLSQLNPNVEVHAVATVQEEVGLRGAQTSAFGIDPHFGLAVDVGFATDTPMMKKERRKAGEIKVGKGPIITRGANVNPKLFDRLVQVAGERDIPYQIASAPGGTGTDANAIQLTRSGVVTGLLSIPNRYMHSPCEVVSLRDLENISSLLAYSVEDLDPRDYIPF